MSRSVESRPRGGRRRRSRLRWHGFRLLTVGGAVMLTAVLAQAPVGAAFTGRAADTGNTVTSAGNFCPSPPAPTTLTSQGDSWVDPNLPTADNHNDTDLYVRSSSTGNRRTWIRFDLPTAQIGCRVASAVLRVHNRVPSGGRTIDVYWGAATPQWTSASINWNSQPAILGPAVGAVTPFSAGWQQWTVTAHVRAQYTDGNNGFLLRDRSEGAGSAVEQVYDDLQSTTGTAPQLVITWG